MGQCSQTSYHKRRMESPHHANRLGGDIFLILSSDANLNHNLNKKMFNKPIIYRCLLMFDRLYIVST